MYQLLNTIISRCQIITFEKNKIDTQSNSLKKIAESLYKSKSDIEKFINENGINYIDEVIEYINKLEKFKEKTIALKNKEFLEIFNDRTKLNLAFQLFVMYYKDVLNKSLGLNCDYFNDYIDSLDLVIKKNTVDKISKKIKIIVDLSININYNLNSVLLLDNLVMKISEV